MKIKRARDREKAKETDKDREGENNEIQQYKYLKDAIQLSLH